MFHPERSVQPHNGRLYVHLADVDGKEVYPHGIVVAPATTTTQQAALQAVDRAYAQAIRSHPEDWNYDDVIRNLEAAGWDYIACAYWVEHEAAVDLDDDGTAGTRSIEGPSRTA